jgi:ribosome biogenesis GTPase
MFRHGVMVRFDGGPRFCAVAKTFRALEGASALAVGDAVTVALSEEHVGSRLDKDRAEGFILSRRPRATALSRPQPMSAKRLDPYEDVFEKVIVANMDQLLMVAAVRQPALRPALIERFLIVAERGSLAAVLAINKADLGAPREADLEYLASLNLKVVLCSAVTGRGLDELGALLAGRSTVLAGASGVGKSSLINALIPGSNAVTGEVRMKDERGRHTTAAAAVYDLAPLVAAIAAPRNPAPADAGHLGQGAASAPLPTVGPAGVLVDTPGLRELGFSIHLDELPWYFPEFEPFFPNCRMSKCTHTHEPDCAVLGAVEAGTIPGRRFESYLRMRESME